jgi:glucose/arabinose dehydrogenase
VKARTGDKCTSSVCGIKEVKAYKDLPWGLANLPNGRVLTSQRDAHTIIRTNPKTGGTATVGKVPNVESTDGEGGLLGIAVDPAFEDNGLIYIMHTSPTDNRVVRMKIVDGKLDTTSSKVLLSGIDRNKFHNGGRIASSPRGMLYIATGDGQDGTKAQDKDSLNGKILRMKPDGSVPTSNPYGNYVWSYGHRNPQGLAFDSKGRLWEQEFGNSIMDEVNLIKKGGNYGWEDCEGTEGDCDKDGFIAPKRTYPTSEGSCSGIEIVKDTLYTACLRGQRLMASKIDGTKLGEPEFFFNGTFGRLRTVQKTPGGNLWLTTSNNGDKDSVPNNTDGRLYKVELNAK